MKIILAVKLILLITFQFTNSSMIKNNMADFLEEIKHEIDKSFNEGSKYLFPHNINYRVDFNSVQTIDIIQKKNIEKLKNDFIKNMIPKLKNLASQYKRSNSIATIEISNISDNDLCNLLNHINNDDLNKLCSFKLSIVLNNKSKSFEKTVYEKLIKEGLIILNKNDIANYLSNLTCKLSIRQFVKYAGSDLTIINKKYNIYHI